MSRLRLTSPKQAVEHVVSTLRPSSGHFAEASKLLVAYLKTRMGEELLRSVEHIEHVIDVPVHMLECPICEEARAFCQRIRREYGQQDHGN